MELGEKLSPDNYLLKSLTRVCHLKNDTIVHRLPITKGVLKLLLDGIREIYCARQPYLLTMYSTMFAMAYYGLFPIGEFASGPHVVLARNVHIGVNKNKMLFILNSSKTHTKGDKPQLVKITSTPTGVGEVKKSAYCSFSLLKKYVAIRPHSKNDE